MQFLQRLFPRSISGKDHGPSIPIKKKLNNGISPTMKSNESQYFSSPIIMAKDRSIESFHSDIPGNVVPSEKYLIIVKKLLFRSPPPLSRSFRLPPLTLVIHQVSNLIICFVPK
jgi:hypothetical protein